MEIIMNLLLMLGGVGVFMHGMKQMSNGIEQSAGSGIRNLFKRISRNRVMDYGVGIGTTILVQSSSATSIMTIGLANAGIVNTKQGSGIILGAKVGTTLTAFIFALSGVSKGSFSISAIFASMAFVGVIISMTTSRDSLKRLSIFLIGFGLLFLGLEIMESAIGGSDSVLGSKISNLFAYESMQNPILLVLLGVLFTCIIQSSTAATGIFIALLGEGVIGSIDQSFFLVMGANIGTCSDGIMAAFGSNTSGKRIAIFHLMTSTIGALAFTIILAIFRTPIVNLFDTYIPNPKLSLAIYNLSYNFIYTVILLCLLDFLVAFVARIVKEKNVEQKQLKYIDEILLSTPTIAISQTQKEVYDMALLAEENLARAFTTMLNSDMSQSKKIAECEYQIDFMTKALANYIIKISACHISYADEKLLGGLHHVINDIERIGDHAVLFARETNYMHQNQISFLDETKTELNAIYNKINEMFTLSLETFKTRRTTHLTAISDLQKTITDMATESKNENTTRLISGQYPVEVSKSLYAALLSVVRVADHLVNIAFSVRSSVGSKTETFAQLEKDKKKV